MAIPRVKRAIRSVKECQARAAALRGLTAPTAEEAERLLLGQLAGALAPSEDGRAQGVAQAKE
jgi:hypothetical protein